MSRKSHARTEDEFCTLCRAYFPTCTFKRGLNYRGKPVIYALFPKFAWAVYVLGVPVSDERVLAFSKKLDKFAKKIRRKKRYI